MPAAAGIGGFIYIQDVRPTTDGFGGNTQEFRFHHQS
jgi:hypothetical protein